MNRNEENDSQGNQLRGGGVCRSERKKVIKIIGMMINRLLLGDSLVIDQLIESDYIFLMHVYVIYCNNIYIY